MVVDISSRLQNYFLIFSFYLPKMRKLPAKQSFTYLKDCMHVFYLPNDLIFCHWLVGHVYLRPLSPGIRPLFPTMINFGSVLGLTIPILANRQALHGRGTQNKKTDRDSPTIWISFLQFVSAKNKAIASASLRVFIVLTFGILLYTVSFI